MGPTGLKDRPACPGPDVRTKERSGRVEAQAEWRRVGVVCRAEYGVTRLTSEMTC